MFIHQTDESRVDIHSHGHFTINTVQRRPGSEEKRSQTNPWGARTLALQACQTYPRLPVVPFFLFGEGFPFKPTKQRWAKFPLCPMDIYWGWGFEVDCQRPFLPQGRWAARVTAVPCLLVSRTWIPAVRQY